MVGLGLVGQWLLGEMSPGEDPTHLTMFPPPGPGPWRVTCCGVGLPRGGAGVCGVPPGHLALPLSVLEARAVQSRPLASVPQLVRVMRN